MKARPKNVVIATIFVFIVATSFVVIGLDAIHGRKINSDVAAERKATES